MNTALTQQATVLTDHFATNFPTQRCRVPDRTTQACQMRKIAFAQQQYRQILFRRQVQLRQRL